MKKLKVYIDTSVIGGCFDKIFQEWSNKLFAEFISGKKIAVISDTVLKELESAPKEVREKIETIPNEFVEKYEITAEIINLTEKYLEQKIVTNKFRDDALHIAIATVLNVDVLVSWNFKHIVNLNRIRQFNSINLFEGYKELEIRTPREVLDEQ
jgi:predicted nucleic acid-binding protein